MKTDQVIGGRWKAAQARVLGGRVLSDNIATPSTFKSGQARAPFTRRWSSALATLLMLVPLLVLPVGAVRAHHGGTLPGVVVQPPMSGYWDRFGASPPTSHHRPFGGDFAVDFHRNPGTDDTVRVRAYPASGSGSVRYRIDDVRMACKSGVHADGGRAVKVGFFIGDTRVGHAWYVHLDRVPSTIKAGSWVSHAAVVGYISRFKETTCYDVSSNDGVHVHLEYYSNRHYACWISRPAGTWVDYWGAVAKVGGNYRPTSTGPCP